MKMTLKKFIESYEVDVDVRTDFADTFKTYSGVERGAHIAFCPGDKLTAEGKKQWSSIMDLEVDVDGLDAVVHIPNADEETMEQMQTDVMMLFYTFAGYVRTSFYVRMIEEEECYD